MFGHMSTVMSLMNELCPAHFTRILSLLPMIPLVEVGIRVTDIVTEIKRLP